MSTKVASLYAEIGAETKGFEKGAAGVKSSLGQLAGNFLTSTALIAGFEEALRFSINAAAESEAVNAKLNAVIASTGGAAGMTADEIDKMSTSLSRMSTFDDEAIKSSSALLLTFTQIGQDVFPEAQQAILDMSAALGQDLQSSTIQLGKALNDPIKGITALSRVGVSFTEEQKEMIKVLVESGDTMGAQKLILQELSREFGGQALAASKTYAGQISQLENEVGNLGEAVGNGLIPEIKELAMVTKSATIFITDNYETIKKWGAAFLPLPLQLAEISRGLRGIFGEADKVDNVIDVAAVSTENFGEKAMAAAAAAEMEEVALKDLSDTYSGMIGTIQSMQDAEENYTRNMLDLAEQRLNVIEDNERAITDLAKERAKIEKELAELRAEDDKDNADRIQAYVERLADLSDRENEQKDNYIANLDEIKQREAELADERDKQALQFVSNILMEQLARDGWTENEFNAFAEQQEAWGLWSSDVVEKAKEAWAEADKVAASIDKITVATQGATAAMNEFGGIGNTPYGPPAPGENEGVTFNSSTSPENYEAFRRGEELYGQGNGYYNFEDGVAVWYRRKDQSSHAAGGSFVIPSSYGNEGFQLGGGDTASGGEKLTITPEGKDIIDYDRMARSFALAVRDAILMTGR